MNWLNFDGHWCKIYATFENCPLSWKWKLVSWCGQDWMDYVESLYYHLTAYTRLSWFYSFLICFDLISRRSFKISNFLVYSLLGKRQPSPQGDFLSANAWTHQRVPENWELWAHENLMNTFLNFHYCISNANLPCPKTGPLKLLKYLMEKRK